MPNVFLSPVHICVRLLCPEWSTVARHCQCLFLSSCSLPYHRDCNIFLNLQIETTESVKLEELGPEQVIFFTILGIINGKYYLLLIWQNKIVLYCKRKGMSTVAQHCQCLFHQGTIYCNASFHIFALSMSHGAYMPKNRIFVSIII